MLRVDPEFRALIPPLRPDERAALEESIAREGCRDALLTWEGVLLDGHNRHDICTRLGVEYRMAEVAGIGDRLDARIWIRQHQTARRNLTDDQRSLIGGRLADDLAERSRRERAQAGAAAVERDPGSGKFHRSAVDVTAERSEGPQPVPREPRAEEQAAASMGVSVRRLRDARRIERERPDLAAKVEAGGLSIREARGIVKQERKAEVAEQIRAEPPPAPAGPYRVIVADPPWKYTKRVEDITHRARLPYPEMTTEEVCALPVDEMAADDCVLWLWTTNAFLRDAFRVIDAWGFAEKTVLTWAKSKMGTGDWLRGKTEHCILAVRGRPLVTLTNQTTLLDGPVREHSRKPDEFFALVESLCPGSKLEMFAREARPGWAAWGGEVGKFNAG